MEIDKVISMKTAQRAIGSKCKGLQDNESINLWQCRMEIDKVISMKTAQRAISSKCKSFQSRGHCYDKKSERVGNSASTQLVGSCHDEKSERAGCIASTQKDSTFQLIVGFKQYHQSSTLIGEHFIASNYAAPSILCSTPHWG